MQAESVKPSVSAETYVGVFLIALATLAYELVLTRIFSVTLWYHFAFLAISLAMFGMTVGSLLIYLFPKFFSQEKTQPLMALSAALFAATMPVALLTHSAVPILVDYAFVSSAPGLFAILINCISLAVPFVMGGVCISLALTRFPNQVGKLYACDLIGAAIACFVVVRQLEVTDGPSTILLAATIAAVAAILFAGKDKTSCVRKFSIATCVCLGLLTLLNVALPILQQPSFFRLVWIKGTLAPKPAYEKWNSFSDVRVLGDEQHPYFPWGWGLDPKFITGRVAGSLTEQIDAGAGTAITNFHGDFKEVEYLKYDATNIVHSYKHNANVLVIGVGGGRDVLSALAFGQKSVLGIELNNHILDALTGRFADFAGHLERYKNVRLFNDEARSFITRLNEKFDIIEISLIDTWATTASGAFALAENALYTTEGFDIFLKHLNPDGVLSVSRWYAEYEPVEIYRLLALASASLENIGIKDPRAHLVLVRFKQPNMGSQGMGIGTLLISKAPFTAADLVAISDRAQKLGLQVTLAPTAAMDPNLVKAVSHVEIALQDGTEVNLSPPSDNSPYFFQWAKPSSMINPRFWLQLGSGAHPMQGLAILAALMVILSALLAGCVFLPLIAKGKQPLENKSFVPLCAYFLCIGNGFMFLELSQMQRLTVLLGHPTYGLTVVLFTMLLFSGLGSFFTGMLDKVPLLNKPSFRLALTGVLVILAGVFTEMLLTRYAGSPSPVRIAVAIGLLAPPAFFAGTAFPTGIKLAAAAAAEDLMPWLWGVNGAASVLASVVAVGTSICLGISYTYGLACLFYFAAAIASIASQRKPDPASPAVAQ